MLTCWQWCKYGVGCKWFFAQKFFENYSKHNTHTHTTMKNKYNRQLKMLQYFVSKKRFLLVLAFKVFHSLIKFSTAFKFYSALSFVFFFTFCRSFSSTNFETSEFIGSICWCSQLPLLKVGMSKEANFV